MIALTKTAVTWQDAKKEFAIDRVDLADKTLTSYVATLDRLIGDSPDIRLIGRLHIRTFLQQYTKSSTYNTNLFAIKTFFAWAAEFYGFKDPAAGLVGKHRTDPPNARVIKPHEYRAISAMSGQYRDWCVFLGNTGLRASEFCGLRDRDIHPDHLTICGKGGKVRSVPLNRTAASLLSRCSIPINFRKNRYIHRNHLTVACRALSKILKIPLFGPHALRHYFATALIDRGANIAQVSRILGHSSIQMTIAMYYHPTDLDRVVGLLDE